MKKIYILFVLTPFITFCQTEEEIVETQKPGDSITTIEDETILLTPSSPEYPGGMTALQEYLEGAIHRTAEADSAQIQGIVLLKFKVDKKGEVSEVVVLRGLGYGLDEIAIEAIEGIPEKFTPARNNGVLVDYIFTIPIKFLL